MHKASHMFLSILCIYTRVELFSKMLSLANILKKHKTISQHAWITKTHPGIWESSDFPSLSPQGLVLVSDCSPSTSEWTSHGFDLHSPNGFWCCVSLCGLTGYLRVYSGKHLFKYNDCFSIELFVFYPGKHWIIRILQIV